MYRGDTLEGVVGIDVTVQQMIDGVLDLDLPWGGHPLLISAEGSLLAASPAASAELGLGTLPDVSAGAQVEQDTLPAAYNLSAQPETAQIAALISSAPAGFSAVGLRGSRLVSWAHIRGTNWTLLFVIDEAAVSAPADQVRADAMRLGTLLALGIIVFYGVYLLVLYRRSVRAAELVVAPLEQLRAAIAAIAAGEYIQAPVRSHITELDQTAQDVIEMGAQLNKTVDALIQKEAALQTAQARADAERDARVAKTQFLANISHEIRTPMNGVMGLLELLEADGAPEQLPALRAARSSGQSLLLLIDDLLDTAKLEVGKMTLESRPLALHTLANGVIQLFSAQADAKGLALVLSIAPGVPEHIQGDELRLRQILNNLVSNALKFTASGEVRLSLAPCGEGLLCFDVSDTGIGIPPDRLTRIMEPFSQADASTTRRFGGTGLGLTICAGLIAEMSGQFAVESTVGEGSRFRVTLPAVACAPPTEAAEQPQEPARVLRILVAEDNAINQLVVKQMLERLGHTYTMTADGEEALARYAPGAFDVGIFDVHMPRMDGLTLTRTLRQREAATGAQRLPVLALTASVMADELAACRAAGMDAHLTKPIALRTLARALQALAGPQPRAAQTKASA